MEEAQEGIQNKAGRATYLALERCCKLERAYRLDFGDVAKFPVATHEGDIFATSWTISGIASRQKAGAVT